MPLINIPISVIQDLVADSEETTLKDDVLKTGTALSVKNNEKFSANQYVIIGKLRTETAEIRKISTVTGNETINLVADPLLFDHAAGDPVTFINYNQVKIYRATSAGGTYGSPIATVDLEVSAGGTSYNDTTGTSGNYYKFTYYNEQGAVESAFSDEIPGSGYTIYMLFSMVDDVGELIGDKLFEQVTRKSIENKINHHQLLWWFSPYAKRELKVNNHELATDDGVQTIDLPVNYDKFQDEFSVRYEYNPDAATDELQTLKPLSKSDFWHNYGDLTADDADELQNYWIDISVSPAKLYLGPTPKTAAQKVFIDYLKKVTTMDNQTDATECPVPRLITLSVAIEILGLRGDADKVKELKEQRNQLLAGEVEHGRTQAGSMEMEFQKDYGKGKYN